MIYAAAAIAAVLMLVAALLRAAGASLVRTLRVDALHDAAEGARGAFRVATLLDDRALLQPALGMVHSSLMVLTTAIAGWTASRLASGYALFGLFTALVLVLVLAGDVLPRSYGRAHPRRLAYRFAPLLVGAYRLGAAASDFIYEEDGEITEEDDDDAEERELISSVLEFADTIVREVMVPRPDMITVAADDSSDRALAIVLKEGRSRVPVTGSGIDDIVGLLYARDLLQLMDDAAGHRSCRDLMHSAYFVPETKQISELLREMQARQIHLAVVVDEFGGTAGLVTIEDLLEEIVGEIVDEYDNEAPMVVPADEGGYLVDARLGVDALAELVGTDLPSEEWDTVGGLLMGLAGRVPREGERFEFEGFVLVAEQVKGRRVATVRIVDR